MLWPLSVVLVANTNGRLAILALAGLLVLPNESLLGISKTRQCTSKRIRDSSEHRADAADGTL